MGPEERGRGAVSTWAHLVEDEVHEGDTLLVVVRSRNRCDGCYFQPRRDVGHCSRGPGINSCENYEKGNDFEQGVIFIEPSHVEEFFAEQVADALLGKAQ